MMPGMQYTLQFLTHASRTTLAALLSTPFIVLWRFSVPCLWPRPPSPSHLLVFVASNGANADELAIGTGRLRTAVTHGLVGGD
jgi:hypothetical protein